jgi:hypothetical protein
MVCACPLLASNSVTRDIEAIIQLARHERAFGVRLELSFIDKAIAFDKPLSTDAVDWDYTTKVSLEQESAVKLINEFVDVVKKADLKETDYDSEWRLSFIVRGAWGRRYLAVYTDASNRLIKIDGKRYFSNREIASWIDKRLWVVEEAVEHAIATKEIGSSR